MGSADIINLPGAEKVLVGGHLVWLSSDRYRKLTGIHYDGAVVYDTGMKLYGYDSLKFSFSATKACNVLGCYTDAGSQTNFSLYVSTSSSAKYMRYNGGAYNSYIATNTRYDVIVTPTGTRGMRVDSSWTAKTFVSDSDMLIGSTSYGATSSKFTGNMYGAVIIPGRAYWQPYERIADGKIIYVDMISGKEIENVGTGTPTPLGYE